MSRPKGSRNKVIAGTPPTLSLSVEERIQIIANLIVDRIIDDQQQGETLLKQLEGASDEQPVYA